MPFNHSDLYTVSAGTELYKYYNPFVTKFDSQSFYNFEQDNQPLYDLEERTHYLWEKATGYGTSSLVGMPLVVSGSLDANNRNVFTNLQDAVDSLPAIIRTPTLIEVAVSGTMGGLRLTNVKIAEGGALEIVNRGFAKIYTGQDAEGGGPVGRLRGAKAAQKTRILRDNYGVFGTLSSIDLSATIQETRVMSVQTNVSSLFFGDAAGDYNITFLQYANLTTGNRRRNDKLTVSYMNPEAAAVHTFTSSINAFKLTPYENSIAGGISETGGVKDNTINKYDVSAKRGDNGLILRRNQPTNLFYTAAASQQDEVGGLTYVNSLSSIHIENCEGPMYIRGFLVDGASGADALWQSAPGSISGVESGIKVVNSTTVLENCAAMRAKKHGAEFVNSDVTLSRGFFAYRNYQVLSPGLTRVPNKNAGLYAVNSTVNLAIDTVHASGNDYLFNIQAQDTGIRLDNSVLTGGQSRPTISSRGTNIALGYNNVGLEANNSRIDVSGNLDIYQNNAGISLTNSKLSTDRLTVENNSDIGLLCDRSTVEYNNTLTRKSYARDVSGLRMEQTLFQGNGTHLHLKGGSMLTYTDVSSLDLPSKFGSLRFNGSHGVVNKSDRRFSLPAIKLSESRADLIHSRIIVSSLERSAPGLVGAGLLASNNSVVNFLGTASGATIVQGPPSVAQTLRVVGICAENGSTASFRGPTVVGQFGVACLADNNSTIEVSPHRKEDFTVDTSAFNLAAPENHTSVEIHSSFKACLVANNNSNLVMGDLGNIPTMYSQPYSDLATDSIASYVSAGSMQFYPNPTNTAYTANGGKDNLASLALDGEASHDQMKATVYTVKSPHTAAGADALGAHINYFIADPWALDASADVLSNHVTGGGICVGVYGNSTAKVNNVHFPCGYVNADGSFFDASSSAGRCNQLKIWNIGDTSKLYASHLAVSGMDPSGRQDYYGPRSTHFSTANEEANGSVSGDSGFVSYSGLPSTPHVSSLSICDFYGLGVHVSGGKGNEGAGGVLGGPELDPTVSSFQAAFCGAANVFGAATHLNAGPFRLFFPVNSAARFLGYASSVAGGVAVGAGNPVAFSENDNKPHQHMAQGYGLSGPAGVDPSKYNVSALMHQLVQPSYQQYPQVGDFVGLQASGFYYASAFMDNTNGVNIYLDESAADVFSNAKNAALPPFAGRPGPLVTIYRSTTDHGGEGDNAASVIGHGIGLRSTNIFDIRRKL